MENVFKVIINKFKTINKLNKTQETHNHNKKMYNSIQYIPRSDKCLPLLVQLKVHKQHSSSSSQLLQLSTEHSDSPLSSRSRNSLEDQKSASQASLFSEKNSRISPDCNLRFYEN